MTKRRAFGALFILCAFACKKPAAIALDAATEQDAPSDAPGAEAGVPATDAESEDGGREREVRKSRTQEELFDEATQNVRGALGEAKEKKPDCGKIVDLLDVSFAVVDPPMTPEDRSAYGVFAACAKKEQRWRLLRAVANAIIAGDTAQKTTYYLPRALLGLAQYDVAARLSAAALRSWPKEGEAYTTAALASTRIEDWEACSKQADQALLVQHQKGLSDEISAQAHMFKGEALLHLGKVDESSKELDIAKKIKASPEIAKLRERNDVVKSSGLLLDADMPDEVPLGIYSLLVKAVPFTGGLVTLRLANTSDKPVAVRVEVSLSDVAEPIGKSVTVVKGKRETMRLTPPLRADFKASLLKAAAKHDLAYKVSTSDGQVLYEEIRHVSVLPHDELPIALELHQIDNKPATELAAAWVTPAAKPIEALLEAAKKRAPGGKFDGKDGLTLPQAKAVWDELRERGFRFVREPSVDSEASRSHPAHLPGDVLEARGGQALEGSLLFASLLEAIGLDVVLVHVPGHVFLGWLPSKADHGAPEAMGVTVQSPAGSAFFLETTMVGNSPVDAAVLRADAELVDAATKKVFEDGRGSFLRLPALRKLGIAPQGESESKDAKP
jgi:tetratricopeptide (TPR) repeat protein